MKRSRCVSARLPLPLLLLVVVVDAARATDCVDPAAPESLGVGRALRRNLSKDGGRAAEPAALRWAAVDPRALFATQDDHEGEGEVSPETLLAVADEEKEEANEEDTQSFRTLKGSIFEHLPVFSLASSKINNSLCVRHSRIFLHELKKYKLWAMQMFDAGAKLGPGVLRGSATHLGDYDECLAVSARLGPSPASERVRGRYCLLAVDVEVDPSWSGPRAGDLHTAVNQALIYRPLWSSRFDRSHFVPRASTVGWAVCVPASCSPADVQQAVDGALAPYNGSAYGLSVGVRAEPHQCYARPDPADSGLLPLGTVLATSALLFVGVVAIIATLRDMNGTGEPENRGNDWKLVQAFSLYRTWAEFTGTLSPDRNILCIFGLRALLAILLYIEHAIIPMARTPYINRVDFLEKLKMPATVALRIGSHCTDSFLLMSGVLGAYSLTRELQSTGKIKWLKWVIGRYIRLTPALLAFVLVSGYIMDHLGEGPMWGELINQNSQLCKQYGWRNLLYMQNFFAFEDMCGPHTHHLAIDMQLSLFLPLMIYLLHMNAVVGTVVLFSVNAVSTWLRFSRTVEHDLSIVIFHSVKPSQLYRTANVMYGLPLPRASPYIFGVLLGFYIKKTEKSLRIPKILVAAGWIVAILLASCSILLAKNVYKLSYIYNVYDAANFAAWAPLAWSSALCWVILVCHAGYAGKLNNILSLKPLVILSRISYALYMIQFPVFYYYVGINRSAKVFTIMSDVFPLQGVTVVLILSVILTLLFDLPMQHVKNILMRSSQRPEKEQTKKKCS